GSRIVVPELPQSSGPDAARRPRIPRPSILKSSITTPSDLMHEAVDCTSAPVDSPRTRLSPEAIEPNISARCEMDLSPGTVIAPSSFLAGRTVAITPGLHLPARRGGRSLPRLPGKVARTRSGPVGWGRSRRVGA